MNRSIITLLTLLGLLGAPWQASALPSWATLPAEPASALTTGQETGILSISSSPTGADVYIDGVRFPSQVTSCEIELAAGTYTIELKIPGYETYVQSNVAIQAGQTTTIDDVVQLPVLLDATVITVNDPSNNAPNPDLTVATLGANVTLRNAVYAILNDTSDTHYRIEFAPGVSTVDPGETLTIDRRGNLTIDGDRDRDGSPDVQIASTSSAIELNVLASNVRLIGLIFSGIGYEDATFQMKPSDTAHPRYDIENFYLLGSSFTNSFEIGGAPCGAFGYAATSYGGTGTFNLTNIVFAGNSLDQTSIFTFAGAGNEDYNVVDGYQVVANTFVNKGIGILAGDAHTWYVYGSDSIEGNGGVPGQMGFSNHNVVKNVLISGNHFTFNENALTEWSGAISVSVANMGNSYNTTQDVVIRNNVADVLDPAGKNLFSSSDITNNAVGDENSRYDAPENVENGNYNSLRNVVMEYNDLEFGAGRALQVYNISTGGNSQNGSHNLSENITIQHNVFHTVQGVFIGNYQGENHGNVVEDNQIQTIVFTDNQVIRPDLPGEYFERSGVRIFGAQERDYSATWQAGYYRHYGGMLSDVTIQGNTITGFRAGISLKGSDGYQHDDIDLSNITIRQNAITTAPHSSSYGIEIHGATLEARGGDLSNPDNLRNGSKNCTVSNVTVAENTIQSNGGIAVLGLSVDDSYMGSAANNGVEGITIEDNQITYLASASPDQQFIKYPIIIAGANDDWDRLEGTGLDILGNHVSGVTLSNNILAGYALQPLNLSQDLLPDSYLTSPDELLEWSAQKTNTAAGENSYHWTWKSTPETNSTADHYLARGFGQLGNYPNLLSPAGIYVEFIAQPQEAGLSVFLPLIIR